MGTKVQNLKTYKPIPPLLRELRQESGMTQKDLGNILEKPQSWVQYCETAGRRVDLAEFVQWAKACGVDPIEGVMRYLKASFQLMDESKPKLPSKDRLTKEELAAIKGGSKVRRLRKTKT